MGKPQIINGVEDSNVQCVYLSTLDVRHWGIDWDKLDAHHRRLLRMITSCFFNVKIIHNVEQYPLTKTHHPISVTASQQRIRLLGHHTYA